MDMASALEDAESTATSEGFLALKALHLAKVKLLLGSIDSLQLQLKKANDAGIYGLFFFA